jgi:hypothetical protein
VTVAPLEPRWLAPGPAFQAIGDNFAYVLAMLLMLPVIGPPVSMAGSQAGARRAAAHRAGGR